MRSFINNIGIKAVAVLMIFTLGIIAAFAERSDNDSLNGESNQAESLSSEIQTTPELIAKCYPKLENRQIMLIAENASFILYYDSVGADIYLTDKSTGKIWSNVVSESAYLGSFYNQNFLSQLLSVRIVDDQNNVEMYSLFDAETNSDTFSVTAKCSQEKLILSIQVIDSFVSFDVEFWLDDDGLLYSVPSEKIKNSKGFSLVSLIVIPAFGAAVSTEDGYVFYPDGSGALIKFSEEDAANALLYNYPLFGTDEQSLETIDKNEEQETYNLMLPVYGIKHTQGGVFAAVIEGAEDTSLQICPAGFQVSQLYRAYFSFSYRLYATQTIGDKQDVRITPGSILTTRTVKFFILSGEKNTYSDMAEIYRNYLLSQKTITQKTGNDVPLSIDFFMGTTKTGLFSEQYVTVTSFDQVQEIIGDLKKSGIDSISATLLSWNTGGWNNTPTPVKPANALGGKKGLGKLIDYCEENEVKLYLNMDLFVVNKEHSSINLRRNTVHDYYGNIISDGTQERFLLSPESVLKKYCKQIKSKIPYGKTTSVNFDKIGKILVCDYKNGERIDRYSIADQYRETLSEIKKERGFVSVTGGNEYVLPYADKINDLPVSDSGYYQNSEAVPFYQMVVHGSVDYNSSAGNLEGDLDLAVLEWIETGSAPHFIVTNDSPNALHDTDYKKLFSSEYSQWKEKIKEIHQKLQNDFGKTWNCTIVRHTILSENVKQIEYSDGTVVYLNYSDEEKTINDITVSAVSYAVIRG